MRILTVSAHYPPNFVSGGTLQPQRLARGLAARGHDVSVFAGWLGERAPLDEWDDKDETGLPVHWIVSSPWIGWADDLNWDNLAVTEAFRSHVRSLQPDIVHFHSLQSLGAGLLPAARAAGARVVVTMHDFWWVCARQFLVDRDMRPCSLVVDAGVCPCEVDVDRRDHRACSLRTFLASADAVLAPSTSAARVLAANGIAPGRLDVDENGLPESVTATKETRRTESRAARSGSPVRLLYAGGPDPMKGVDVLLDAVNLLEPRTGWRLTAYGIESRLAELGRRLESLPVDVAPPFAPAELGRVLADHDVLVLPSVMRESHSLLTREALGAGLPVVCTDTLGPEEVVVHDDNGLVVPGADATALAAALDRLLTEPGLLDRLALGARKPLATRLIEDQVIGLEQRYQRLLDESTTPPPPVPSAGGSIRPTPVRSVVFVCGIEGAPLRYRARLPAEALARRGVRSEVLHYRDPELVARCGSADIVVFYRVPATRQVLSLIEAIRAGGIPTVFDVDDLIFDPDLRDEIPALRLLPDDEARLWLEGVARYRTTLEACDGFIGSTRCLVDHARDLTDIPAYQFDNGVGLLLARQSDAELRRPRRPGPLRIGYLSGTTTHDEDWFFVEPAVIEALDRHEGVELWLGGYLPHSAALARFGSRVVQLPFVDWSELPAILRDLDVNLSPLTPASRFNEAKSAIKWLEAALCSTPTIASPTEPFRAAIEHGRTGLMAETTAEWVTALDLLLTDASARGRIGALARREALLRWSPDLQAERYLDILDDLRRNGPGSARRPRERASGWQPVALDEPPIGHPLEPYELPSTAPAGRPAATVAPTSSETPDALDRAWRRASSLARRGIESVRRDGAGPTTRKAVAKVRNRLGHPEQRVFDTGSGR